MKERIAIVDGIRTPFCKYGGVLKKLQADDIGAFALKGLLVKTGFPIDQVDEVIMGNGVQPHTAGNPARVAAIKAGIPFKIPAYTVQRNCASGMEAISTAANKILADEAEIIIAGSMESMTNVPLIYGEKMTAFFTHMMKAKTLGQKLKTLLSFRLGFLAPVIALEHGLTDHTCGMIMGKTAELLSREFGIDRRAQDEFALHSHQKATAAIKEGRLGEEIVRIPVPPKYEAMQEHDDGPRFGQSMEALQKLRPYFEKITGTVTAGNSSQITDGGVATLLMRESKAKELGLKPLGYLVEYAYAGLEGCRMGLGPVYSTAKLFEKTGLTMKDFDLFEINEAFAAQVIACVRASESETFAKEKLGRSQPLGEIPMDKLNVNGGAIALGHPVGATGTRLVLTILKELRRRQQNRGLATLCIGGGQGASMALEVE